MSHPTAAEARRIAALIAPDFDEYLARYDTHKYPAEVYDQVCAAFASPRHVRPADIESALLWKFGHVGKARYPRNHAKLIEDVQGLWPTFLASRSNTPATAMDFWTQQLGRPKAFVSIAFLVHLLHQQDLPIIDQHNYRAVNHYMQRVRASWNAHRVPAHLDDLMLVAAFIRSVLSAWPPGPRQPSARDLDKYLMMFGKALKAHRPGRATRLRSALA